MGNKAIGITKWCIEDIGHRLSKPEFSIGPVWIKHY